MGFRPERLEASEVIGEVLQLEAERLSRKEVRTEVTAPAGIELYADPEMTKMILSRIVCNAAKFSQRGGRVAIAARRISDQVLLEVTDEGLGVTEADQQRLFRSDPPLHRPGSEGELGLGMGLCLAKGLTEEQGGKLEFRSVPGLGTSVSVLLPAAA